MNPISVSLSVFLYPSAVTHMIRCHSHSWSQVFESRVKDITTTFPWKSETPTLELRDIHITNVKHLNMPSVKITKDIEVEEEGHNDNNDAKHRKTKKQDTVVMIYR